MAKAKPIPEGYNSITPYLIVKGASAAIDFYKQAFSATEVMRMPIAALNCTIKYIDVY